MKKIILTITFMLVAFSAFGKSLIGHWDLNYDSKHPNVVISFYADMSFVTAIDGTGKILKRGKWTFSAGILKMDGSEPLIVTWIDNHTIKVGFKGTDNTVIIRKQSGIE